MDGMAISSRPGLQGGIALPDQLPASESWYFNKGQRHKPVDQAL